MVFEGELQPCLLDHGYDDLEQASRVFPGGTPPVLRIFHHNPELLATDLLSEPNIFGDGCRGKGFTAEFDVHSNVGGVGHDFAPIIPGILERPRILTYLYPLDSGIPRP